MNGRGSCAKRWCFTINNPDEEQDVPRWDDQFDRMVTDGLATYIIAGWEVGDSGTPHIQGYIELSKKQRITWLKSHLSERAHYEISNGTAEQASAYCKKEDSFFEYGVLSSLLSKQGQRTDLEAIKEILDDTGDINQVSDVYFAQWVRYHKAFEKYVLNKQERRNWVTEVHVLWGATGTGKSRFVHDLHPNNLWVASDNSLKWFDGYHGEDFVLFDDFVSVKNDRFGFLLQLLDRYAMTVPIKGGFVNWKPRTIYFTSNLPIEQWFTGVTEAQFAALKRRITRQIKFHGTRHTESGSFSHFI